MVNSPESQTAECGDESSRASNEERLIAKASTNLPDETKPVCREERAEFHDSQSHETGTKGHESHETRNQE
jgi:hypothetical protein